MAATFQAQLHHLRLFRISLVCQVSNSYSYSQAFSGFSCTFPAPCIAVVFNNCCFTHREDVRRPLLAISWLVTHHSPLGECLILSVSLVAAFSMQPGEPGQGDHVALAHMVGQLLVLMDFKCILLFQSLPPLLFSSHGLCSYSVCHLPGCFCKWAADSSLCQHECPCTAPFSSGYSSSDFEDLPCSGGCRSGGFPHDPEALESSRPLYHHNPSTLPTASLCRAGIEESRLGTATAVQPQLQPPPWSLCGMSPSVCIRQRSMGGATIPLC